MFWGRVIKVLIEKGWRPPAPDDRITDLILGDMRRVGRPLHGWAATRPQTLDLTPAELRAIQLLADGYRVAEAARVVGVGRESMKAALKAAYRKLAAKSGPHAVAIAMRQGIIE